MYTHTYIHAYIHTHAHTQHLLSVHGLGSLPLHIFTDIDPHKVLKLRQFQRAIFVAQLALERMQ